MNLKKEVDILNDEDDEVNCRIKEEAPCSWSLGQILQQASIHVLTCVEAFSPDDLNVQDEVINKEFLRYKTKDSGFGTMLAARGCTTNNDSYHPVNSRVFFLFSSNQVSTDGIVFLSWLVGWWSMAIIHPI